MVAGRIGDQLEGLRRAGAIACARHHVERAALSGRDHVRPLAEGEAAIILSERRGAPALATVLRYLDTRDAVAAIPGDTLDLERLSHRRLHAVGDVGHERI